MQKVVINGIYLHYKGNKYQLIDIVRHSETTEEMILYKPLYVSEEFPDQMWVRPRKMFLEDVVIDGKKTPRFKLLKTKT